MDTVVSTDGVVIAYERTGHGLPLVLVHGTGRDRSQWARSLPELARHATVYAVDRAGSVRAGTRTSLPSTVKPRTSSQSSQRLNSQPICSVIHTAPSLRWKRHRGRISAWPDSLRASAQRWHGPGTKRPRGQTRIGLGHRKSRGSPGDLPAGGTTVPARGDRGAAGTARMAGLVGLAHTLPREAQSVNRYVFDPERVADLQVPTLLLLGSESPPFFRRPSRRLTRRYWKARWWCCRASTITRWKPRPRCSRARYTGSCTANSTPQGGRIVREKKSGAMLK